MQRFPKPPVSNARKRLLAQRAAQHRSALNPQKGCSGGLSAAGSSGSGFAVRSCLETATSSTSSRPRSASSLRLMAGVTRTGAVLMRGGIGGSPASGIGSYAWRRAWLRDCAAAVRVVREALGWARTGQH
jgi:hypothetical protein